MGYIFIVDDDPQLQKIYSHVLTEAGYEIGQAENGHVALEEMKKKVPDLVLLDIMLPGGMNGFDVFEQMKLEPALKNVKVIFLTNLDSEKKIALAMGAIDYSVKVDTSVADILAKVKKYL